MRLRTPLALVTSVAVAGALAAPAGATLRKATPDGSAFVFDTTEALVAEDTDAARDVYRWSSGGLVLLTPGAPPPFRDFGQAHGISADGTRVVLESVDRLVPEDTDDEADVYLWDDGDLSRISGGARLPRVADASRDLSRVFFTTATALVAADTDDDEDVYVHTGGTTALLSTSRFGNTGSYRHDFRGASADGLRVYEITDEPLVPHDVDGTNDVYERAGGDVRLVSTGRLGSGSPAYHATMRGIQYRETNQVSEDGSSAFFSTEAALEPGDLNVADDLYQRRDGRTRLVSGTQSGIAEPEACTLYCADLHAQSADGSVVAFSARRRLTPDDRDDDWDAYLWRGSTLSRLGDFGPWAGAHMAVAADGSRVVFNTTSALVPEDTDAADDVYERIGAQTRLLTPGTPTTARFLRASRDARTVVFQTGGEVYLTDGGAAQHLHDSWSDPDLTQDGQRVFIETTKRLVPEDTDDAQPDFYLWSGGQLTLISEPQS